MKYFWRMMMAIVAISMMMTLSCDKKEDDKDKDPVLTEKEKAIKDYTDHYLGSAVSDPGWTGNTANCVAGTINQDARDKVIMRLNYFRRLVGLTDNVVENTAQHTANQEASLCFKAENNLSHYPGQNWKCWTQAGYDAAGTANIAWGTATSGPNSVHSVNGVSGFIEDAGANNTAVGHRSWFLMPGLFKLGIGSTNSTCCMQWKDNYNTSGTAPEFIAYPPAGYMPNQITYPRWSFTVPTGASYANATVTMTDASGGNVPLNIVNKPSYQPGSYPLRHLVWEPSINPATVVNDTKYTVTIDGVTGGPKSTYTYEVTLISVPASAKRLAPPAEDDVHQRIFLALQQ